jgi:hypothetical protein
MTFICVLGGASMECDASCARTDAVRWDYSLWVSVSSSQSERRRALGRMLDERVTLLGM